MTAKQIAALKRLHEALGDFIAESSTVEQAEKEPVGVHGYSETALTEMSFSEIKSLAKKHGLNAKGTMEELIDRLMNENTQPSRAEEEELVEEKPVKKTRAKSVGEPEAEDTEEDDGIEAMVIEASKELTDEEFLDYLIENGVKAKGKRQALIAAAVKAVRSGDLEITDDGGDNDGESEEVETGEVETEEGLLDFDELNDPNNADMTEERAAGIEAMTADINSRWKSKELTRKEMIEVIKDYGLEAPDKSTSDKDVLKLYTNIVCLFIGDDGEMPEEDAEPNVYNLNGLAFCCGHQCKWDDEEEQYICETCGHEYQPDEE